MQKEFAEKWGEYCHNVTKPLIALAELNIDTLSRLAKKNLHEDIIHAKKPEDLGIACMQIANTLGLEALKYVQEASSIVTKLSIDTSRAFTDTVRESTAKAAEMSRSAASKTKN